MKKRYLWVPVLTAGLVAAPVAFSAPPATPGPGLLGTAHDFTAAGGGHLPYKAGTALNGDGLPINDVGLCTYCHTPHHGTTTRLLWNHKLSANTFSWDVPSTTAGTTLPSFSGQTYNGVSAKCLSCHDGSVAIGDVFWYEETGPLTLEPTKMGQSPSDPIFRIASTTGSLATNHPVAVPYPFGNAPNTYNTATTGSNAYLDEWQPDPTALGIRLFNDDGSGNITAGPVAGKTGIECSSCHDPHNKQAVDDMFLRGSLAGNDTNYICLKCHVK